MSAFTPLLPIFHPFFQECRGTKKAADWKSLVVDKLITQHDCDVLEQFELQEDGSSFATLEQDECADVLRHSLAKVSTSEAVFQLLTFADRFFPDYVERLMQSRDEKCSIQHSVLRHLFHPSAIVSLKSGALLSSLFLQKCDKAPLEPIDSEFVDSMLRWISNWTNALTSNCHLEIVYMSLSLLLEDTAFIRIAGTKPSFNLLFAKLFENIKLDVKTSYSSQYTYLALLCIWLSCGEKQSVEMLVDELKVLTLLVELFKSANKEKIMRVALRILFSVLSHYSQEIYSLPEVNVLLERLHSLNQKNLLVDEEITELLKQCNAQLAQENTSNSLLEQYVQEITGGTLKWSPIHKNEAFWSKHALKVFEENNFRLLTRLLQTLFYSVEEESICVCLHDLGKYFEQVELKKASNAEQIRKFIGDEEGRKEHFLSFLNHPSKQVQYYALVAVQKFMFL